MANATRTVPASPGAKDSLLTAAERQSQLGRSEVKRSGCGPELRNANSATVFSWPGATRSSAAVPDHETAASQATPTRAVRVAVYSGSALELIFHGVLSLQLPNPGMKSAEKFLKGLNRRDPKPRS